MSSEVEHRECDECFGGAEAEGDAGDQADLGVDRFDREGTALTCDSAERPTRRSRLQGSPV